MSSDLVLWQDNGGATAAAALAVALRMIQVNDIRLDHYMPILCKHLRVTVDVVADAIARAAHTSWTSLNDLARHVDRLLPSSVIQPVDGSAIIILSMIDKLIEYGLPPDLAEAKATALVTVSKAVDKSVTLTPDVRGMLHQFMQNVALSAEATTLQTVALSWSDHFEDNSYVPRVLDVPIRASSRAPVKVAVALTRAVRSHNTHPFASAVRAHLDDIGVQWTTTNLGLELIDQCSSLEEVNRVLDVWEHVPSLMSGAGAMVAQLKQGGLTPTSIGTLIKTAMPTLEGKMQLMQRTVPLVGVVAEPAIVFLGAYSAMSMLTSGVIGQQFPEIRGAAQAIHTRLEEQEAARLGYEAAVGSEVALSAMHVATFQAAMALAKDPVAPMLAIGAPPMLAMEAPYARVLQQPWLDMTTSPRPPSIMSMAFSVVEGIDAVAAFGARGTHGDMRRNVEDLQMIGKAVKIVINPEQNVSRSLQIFGVTFDYMYKRLVSDVFSVNLVEENVVLYCGLPMAIMATLFAFVMRLRMRNKSLQAIETKLEAHLSESRELMNMAHHIVERARLKRPSLEVAAEFLPRDVTPLMLQEAVAQPQPNWDSVPRVKRLRKKEKHLREEIVAPVAMGVQLLALVAAMS